VKQAAQYGDAWGVVGAVGGDLEAGDCTPAGSAWGKETAPLRREYPDRQDTVKRRSSRQLKGILCPHDGREEGNANTRSRSAGPLGKRQGKGAVQRVRKQKKKLFEEG